MNNTFNDDEQLYRAVYPPDRMSMFWKHNGTISDAALKDRNGLSVNRGYYRSDSDVLKSMENAFSGSVISFTVGDCREEKAIVLYKPTKNIFHSEVHGSYDNPVLSSSQRKHLIENLKSV